MVGSRSRYCRRSSSSSARDVAGGTLGGDIQESEQYGLDNEDGFALRNNRRDPLFAARPSADWNADFPLHDHQRRGLAPAERARGRAGDGVLFHELYAAPRRVSNYMTCIFNTSVL